MPDQKLSDLAAAIALGGSDLFYLVQSGVDKSITATLLTSAITASITPASIGALSASTTSTQDGYFGDIFLYDDSTPSHYLRITNSANLTGLRILNINVNDGSRTITLSGNLTVNSSTTLSGTNTGDQTITLIGDVTGTGTGTFTTTLADNTVSTNKIVANNVTYAKLAALSAAGFLGGTAAGNVTELNATTATSLLNAFSTSTKGLVPAPGSALGYFLRDDGSWQSVPTTSPAGSSTELQYRDGSSFGATTRLTWNTSVQRLDYSPIGPLTDLSVGAIAISTVQTAPADFAGTFGVLINVDVNANGYIGASAVGIKSTARNASSSGGGFTDHPTGGWFVGNAQGYGSAAYGVKAQASGATSTGYAILAEALSSNTDGVAVQGEAYGTSSATAAFFSAYGSAGANTTYGVRAQAINGVTTNYAGYFIASGGASSYGGYFSASGGSTNNYAIYTANGIVRFGERVDTAASTTASAGIRIPHGNAPTSPVNGDFWSTASALSFRLNSVTKSIAFTDGVLSNATNSTQDGYFGDVYLYDDATPSHYLRITNSANLTLNRALSINVNDADRSISLSGDLTVNSTATISGTNTGDQTITLTSDVTGSGTGSFATTIAANAVTLAKMAQVATATFLGRTTAGTGNVEALTATQATALLNTFTSGLKGLAPASGGGTANFLRADGTWATPPASGTSPSSQTVSASATITGNRVVFTGSTASQTLTLPAAASQDIWVRNSASVAVTIARAGGDTIESATTFVLYPGESIILSAVSTNWTVF